MARYIVEHNYVQMIGPIWQPGFDCCAMDKDLSTYDVRNIKAIAKELFDSDTITRVAIEHWLSLNSGDLGRVHCELQLINTLKSALISEAPGTLFQRRDHQGEAAAQRGARAGRCTAREAH